MSTILIDPGYSIRYPSEHPLWTRIDPTPPTAPEAYGALDTGDLQQLLSSETTPADRQAIYRELTALATHGTVMRFGETVPEIPRTAIRIERTPAQFLADRQALLRLLHGATASSEYQALVDKYAPWLQHPDIAPHIRWQRTPAELPDPNESCPAPHYAQAEQPLAHWTVEQRATLLTYLYYADQGWSISSQALGFSERIDTYQTTWAPAHAFDTYVRFVAQSLALEANGEVPWSLRTLSHEDRDLLLNSAHLFTTRGHAYVLSESVGTLLHGLDAPELARFAQSFVQPTRRDTLMALATWMRSLKHMPGRQPSRAAQQLRHDHQTPGCHATIAFLVGHLRTLNIPARAILTLHPVDKRTDLGVPHRGAVLPTEDLVLIHGDDFYWQHTTRAPTSALFHETQDKALNLQPISRFGHEYTFHYQAYLDHVLSLYLFDPDALLHEACSTSTSCFGQDHSTDIQRFVDEHVDAPYPVFDAIITRAHFAPAFTAECERLANQYRADRPTKPD